MGVRYHTMTLVCKLRKYDTSRGWKPIHLAAFTTNSCDTVSKAFHTSTKVTHNGLTVLDERPQNSHIIRYTVSVTECLLTSAERQMTPGSEPVTYEIGGRS